MNSDVGLLVKTFPTSNLLEETNILIWLQSLGQNGLTPSSINRIIGSCRNFYRYLQLIKEVPKSTNTPFLVPIEYKIGKNSNSKSLNKKESWIPFEIEDVEDPKED
jgi:site-specific recombinase XerD